MHEMGVVLNVINAVEKYANANGISEVKGVVMEIGEVSGVVPSYFASCWYPAVARSRILLNSEVQVDFIPGIARCYKCREEFNIEKNDGKCPKCGSEHWETLSGREVMIKEIYVGDED